jgi:hypothetical protein
MFTVWDPPGHVEVLHRRAGGAFPRLSNLAMSSTWRRASLAKTWISMSAGPSLSVT